MKTARKMANAPLREPIALGNLISMKQAGACTPHPASGSCGSAKIHVYSELLPER
jgi:hypothetical protein